MLSRFHAAYYYYAPPLFFATAMLFFVAFTLAPCCQILRFDALLFYCCLMPRYNAVRQPLRCRRFSPPLRFALHTRHADAAAFFFSSMLPA